MRTLGILLLAVGFILFVAEVYLLFLSLNFRKSRCSKCKGYLKTTQKRQNVYIRRFFYKNYVEYTYEYRVNGNLYSISGGVSGVKGDLKTVVDIRYQTKNPKLAYIHQLTIPMQPIVLVLLFPILLIFLVCGIGLL